MSASMYDSITHIIWTVSNSQKSYVLCRDMICDMVEALEKAEMKYREERKKDVQ